MKKLFILFFIMLMCLVMAVAQTPSGIQFDPTTFVGNLGIVVGIIGVLLVIRKIVDDELKRTKKTESSALIWVLAALGGGVLGALIVNLTRNFAEFDWTAFVRDAFTYASAAAYVYDAKKAATEKKPADPPAVQEPGAPPAGGGA
jgi:hypothetical protein